MRHDFLRRPDLDEPAVLHDGDAVAQLQRLHQVVRDEDHRLVKLALEPDDLVLHVAPDQRVERAERLIEQHDLRIGAQRPGQPHALLHPSRQLVGIGVGEPAEPDDLEHLVGPRGALLPVDPLDLHAERDVVDDPPMREQAEVLEHHGDLPATDLAQPIVVERQDVLSVDQDLAGGRFVQAVQHPHERRLPRARETHHDEDLTRVHVEGHVPDGGHAARLLQELATREVGVGRADDPVGLRPVDLPGVATGNGDLARFVHPHPPLPGWRRAPDRWIVGPRRRARKVTVAS